MKPTVPEVQPYVNAYYAMEGNGAGGSLHIVLDDGNVNDGHVQFCIEFAQERDDPDGVLLARVLLAMSPTQRLKLSRKSPLFSIATRGPFTETERVNLNFLLKRVAG